MDSRVWRQELTPVSFLERSGTVHAERIAVVDGDARFTWKELRARSRRFASELRLAGLGAGERVAFLATNSEPLLLAHFGVPQAGGVLVAINPRLSSEEIAAIVEHSGAGSVFCAPELKPQLARIPPRVRQFDTHGDLEALLASGSEDEIDSRLSSEDDAIAINYTSGTTGRPKGVVTHHRGAALNALAIAIEHRLTAESSYLWTLPMFHCNGWTFPWALAAVGAASVCLPKIDPAGIWQRLDAGISHFCATPTVLIMLVHDPAAHRLSRPVRVWTGGAPPSPNLLARMAELNFTLDHTYGLTETYGPFAINVPPPSIEARSAEEQARYRARQGYPHIGAGEMRVVNPLMRDVPADGRTLGEVVMRGNVLMSGYLDDEDATEHAFSGGWFHSGDLAVRHPDGSIELRDRSKDIIVSGGENIGTIEVEQALAGHPAVLECAVIAVPDEQWGEAPKAFVTLKPGAAATEADLIEHCRRAIARFKAPRSVEFGPLPKTSTGKIRKYVLREREWKGRDKRIN
jgi:fatty-acyl-CoA synthase